MTATALADPAFADVTPIGTELTNWGSKTVDKLDFGPGAGEFGLDANYREGWLMQKLHAPRSYDRKKVKNPIERRGPNLFRNQLLVHRMKRRRDLANQTERREKKDRRK